jgi:hypothetical protein
MSFPPGTEMFQFPGFASPTYVFSERYPKGVGCPIRTSTDQRLLAAPRGFSQRATSFIASWCQGIHRMPFSCSRTSKPPRGDFTPCTGTIPRIDRQWSDLRCQRQPRSPLPTKPRGPSCDGSLSLSTQHAPLNTPGCGRPDTADRSATPNPPVRHRNQARPETHQNLIHPDKDHTPLRGRIPRPARFAASRRSEPDRPETHSSP